MSRSEKMIPISLEAGADLSAKQYFFVAVSADGQIDPAGDGAHADGVLQNNPSAAGRVAEVAIGGVVEVICGGVVTRGGPVASDTNGEAVNPASGDVILGTALETGADGSVISMIFNPRGPA